MTGLHSPTLTNPDMILPYGSPSSAPTSPTPKGSHHSSTQPQHSNSPSSENDGEQTMRKGVRRLFSNGFGSQRKASNTAIQSDKGSTGTLIHREIKLSPEDGHDGLLPASSPTFRDRYDYKSSSDGGSDDLNIDHWEGFDGPIIESVIEQHIDDDRGSLNSHQESRNGSSKPDGNEPVSHPIPDEDEDNPNSHAAMSKRAELILANAKKRLLTMENNLHRARSGLNGRPSSSMSSFTNHNHEPVSLYSIPGMHKSPDGLSPSKHRQGDTFLPGGGPKGHLRMFSESALPSSLNTDTLANKPQSDDIQTLSASNPTDMGSNEVNSSGEQGSGPAHNWFWTGLNRSVGSAGRLNNSLEPLHEDEPTPASFGSPSQGSSPHSIEHRDRNIKLEHQTDMPSPDHENTRNTGLVRKRSTNQMRELRDQMQDLKGKISTLKQRAREDSLRRRSLQSLRTPSPFTAAEQWYGGSPGHQQLGNTTIITSNFEQKRSMSLGRKKVKDYHVEPISLHSIGKDNGEQNKEGGPVKDYKVDSELQGDTSIDTSIETSTNSRSSVHEIATREERVPDKSNGNVQIFEDGYSEEDVSGEVFELSGDSPALEFSSENQVFEKSHDAQESKESSEIQTLEQSSSPIGERHEDRPDAFDYEHFYLHSAMGHYSRRKAVSRGSSHSSVYSVETAKPYNDVAEESSESDDENYNLTGKGSGVDSSSRPKVHLRQSSGQSVSTNATFATATEGGGGGEEETAEDVWMNGGPMAGAWQTDYPSKRRFRINASDASPGADEMTTPTQSSTNMSSRRHIGSPSTLDLLSTLPAFSPSANGDPIPALQLGDGDAELVERLIQSLSKVCTELHIADAEGSGKYEGRQWRRRLDAARRVLEGETNGEAF